MASPTSPSPIQVSRNLETDIEVRVLFFARARELTGSSSDTIRVPPGTFPREALRIAVLPKYPALNVLAPFCAIAVNLDYIPSEDSIEKQIPLTNGDELAVIPPISGG